MQLSCPLIRRAVNNLISNQVISEIQNDIIDTIINSLRVSDKSRDYTKCTITWNLPTEKSRK